MRRLGLLLALLAAGPAHGADPARVDRGYGDRGVASPPYTRDYAALPGGELLAVGGEGVFGVARLDRAGRVAAERAIAVAGGRAEAVVAQPDGRVVVAGSITAGDPPRRTIAVLRLTPDLAPDPSFGDRGVAVHGPVEAGAADVAMAGARIVVLTTSFQLLALDGGGRADPAFSGDGLADPLTELGSPDPGASGTQLHALPDGRLLALGQSTWDYGDKYTNSTPLLLRIGATGVPDATFGDRGIAKGSFINASGLAVRRSGRIVVSGRECTLIWDMDEGDCALLLDGFTPEGRRDPRFGRKGTLAVPHTDLEAFAVATLPGDGLFLGSQSAVARLRPDGRTDVRFGRCGIGAVDVLQVNRIFPQPGGAALLAFADRSATTPGEVTRIAGGSGSAPREVRPPFAPRLPFSDDAEPVATLDQASLFVPAYLPVDARVGVRLTIAGLGDDTEHVPLTARMLRRLRLQRTLGSGAARVRACRERQGVRIRLRAGVRRRLKASRRKPFLLHLDITARNASGARRVRQKLTLIESGGIYNGF